MAVRNRRRGSRSAIVPCGDGGGQATNMSRLGFPDVAWCSIEFLDGGVIVGSELVKLLHNLSVA